MSSVMVLTVTAFSVALFISLAVWQSPDSATKRKVLKMERMLMAMEAAAHAGDLAALHTYARKQENIVNWLGKEGAWDEERILRFLRKRGLARVFHDPEVEQMLSEKVPESERLYGLL